jgi:hypothetical protein
VTTNKQDPANAKLQVIIAKEKNVNIQETPLEPKPSISSFDRG